MNHVKGTIQRHLGHLQCCTITFIQFQNIFVTPKGDPYP